MESNNFPHHIDKELIHWMPLVQFDGEVIVVDEPSKIADSIEYLSTQTIVGVDTETRPSFTRGVHYPTALAQIATESRCYLFRLTHIGVPKPLAALFANPRICKVGLAFKDDLIGLRRRQEFRPANCVDLQKLAPKYGILDLGLQKMFAICFGKKISKAQQLTNWEVSHLTPEQARYASTDAWATLLIYKKLRSTAPLPPPELEELLRSEHEAQVAHQQAIIAARQQ